MLIRIFLFFVLVTLQGSEVFRFEHEAAACKDLPGQIDDLMLSEINSNKLSGSVVLVASGHKIL